MTRESRKKVNLIHDMMLIAISVGAAVALAKGEMLESIFNATRHTRIIGTLISGIFFTSAITTAPAVVALGHFARANSILFTAFIGALGAVAGDLIIFRFVKDRISDDLTYIFNRLPRHERLRAIFERRLFHWLTLFLGVLIIALPLPDELGIALMGISKTRTSFFAPISFIMNFIGILVIGIVAKSI